MSVMEFIIRCLVAGTAFFYSMTCWDLIREDEVDKRVLSVLSILCFAITLWVTFSPFV